jgi:hypothetical protein
MQEHVKPLFQEISFFLGRGDFMAAKVPVGRLAKNPRG